MVSCNHVWRDSQSPLAKKTTQELRLAVIAAGDVGYWLRGEEFELVKPLIETGICGYCENCEGDRAVIRIKERKHGARKER